MKEYQIGVLGAGAWGTALSLLLARNGHLVTLWSAIPEEVAILQKERGLPKKLADVVLPEEVTITGNLEEACQSKQLIVFAVASPYVRDTAKQAAPFLDRQVPIANVAKGIEESTLLTLTEVIESELLAQNGEAGDVAVLSGPSHAEEVGRLMPTTCVAGAKTRKTACLIQDLFMSEFFRVYTSPDVLGIELGGSLKNVIALAAGIADGLGFGDNTKAALITRGINEISRLGMALGGRLETFAGLSGIGDLIVTCTSHHSRNHNAGYLIGTGKTPKEAMEEVHQVVEGVHCARAAWKLAQRHGVEMPIVEQVNEVLFQGKSPKDAVSELLLRDKRIENQNLEWK